MPPLGGGLWGVHKLSQTMGGRHVYVIVKFLFWTRYVRYLMALLCIFYNNLIVDFGIFIFTNLLMECSCIVSLTPDVMVMKGLVGHP